MVIYKFRPSPKKTNDLLIGLNEEDVARLKEGHGLTIEYEFLGLEEALGTGELVVFSAKTDEAVLGRLREELGDDVINEAAYGELPS